MELTLRRLKLEVSMGGGEISDKLSHATHFVVLSVPGSDPDFDAILNSFSSAERPLLCRKRLHIVGYEWLEDSLENDQKLQEDIYSLKPDGLEESNIEISDLDFRSSLADAENQNVSSSSDKVGENKRERTENMGISAASEKDGKLKRGRPAVKNPKRGRTGVNQVRTKRAKIGTRSAKIEENESEKSASSDDASHKQDPIESDQGTQRVQERTGLGEARRTRSKTRSRTENKPTQIDENEPENSADSEDDTYKEGIQSRRESKGHGRRTGIGQVRKTRAKLGKRPAKIDDDVPEITTHLDNTSNKEDIGSSLGLEGINETKTGIKQIDSSKLFNTPRENEAAERTDESSLITLDGEHDSKDEKMAEGSSKINETEGGEEKDTSIKPEIVTDPIQAMLLDMIPSLGVKKPEPAKTFIESEIPQVDPDAGPAKKKKVSYKDVAADLLKDW